MFLLSVKAWRAPGRSPWATPHVAEPVPADGEVALPLGVAGVGGGELGDDVARLLGGGLGGIEVALGQVGGGELVQRGGTGPPQLGRGVVAGGEVGEQGVGARQDQPDGLGGDAGDRAQLLGEVEDRAR